MSKDYTDKEIYAFVEESNRIEKINRKPTQEELAEFKRFMALKVITVAELEKFVAIYQPEAQLRDKYGLDVQVGAYLPPWGGPHIRDRLAQILQSHLSAWNLHIMYEKLHPFMDGNGRSGRALWAWKERDLSLGFLHMFYYQTLSNTHSSSQFTSQSMGEGS